MLCIHAPTCGRGPALEHNGDVYSCDHFVEPGYLLGNIHETHLMELVGSAAQFKFGEDKRDTLTAQCCSCEVRPLCNGGCPKDRFVLSRDGDEGHNYLCSGLFAFFTHTGPAMRMMAELLKHGRAPAEIMVVYAREDAARGPYSPCPCGSGAKFRFCHGTKPPASPFSGVERESAVKGRRKEPCSTHELAGRIDIGATNLTERRK
jgi:uncharacterized protein